MIVQVLEQTVTLARENRFIVLKRKMKKVRLGIAIYLCQFVLKPNSLASADKASQHYRWRWMSMKGVVLCRGTHVNKKHGFIGFVITSYWLENSVGS